MTMSNPAIQNNVNDIKNSIVNIYEIHYTFSTKYLSNFISHLDQIYIYIYIPFIFSITLTTFLPHSFTNTHTHLLKIKYYFSFILTREKGSFPSYLSITRISKRKKRQRNRISSKNIFFHSISYPRNII